MEYIKEKDILHDPLHRWLVYFDENSPQNLIEEVLKMDPAIQKVQNAIDLIQGDEALFRTYLSYEKAASDYISGINGARREGEQNKAIAVAKNLKKRGLPIDQIAEDTGLSLDEIKKL